MYQSKARQKESLELRVEHAERSVRTALRRRETPGAYREAELGEAQAYLERTKAARDAFMATYTPRGRQFASGRVQVITCAGCGKRTTSGVDSTNLELCPACYREFSIANMHSDDGHEGDPADCAECNATFERLTGIKAKKGGR